MAILLNSGVDRIPYERLVGIAAAAISTPIVRAATGVANYLTVVGATAASYGTNAGPLFYMEGDIAGNSTAAGMGVIVLLSPLRIVKNTSIAGTPSVGGALYLTDAGVVDSVPGTIPRRVGTVLAIPAPRSVTWLFDGSIGGSYFSETEQALDALKGISVLHGQLQLRVREVTIEDGASAAVTAEDCALAVLRDPVTGSARTLTLPATPAQGQLLIVKDADASAGASNIVLDGNGYLLDGDATTTLTANGSSRTLLFSGSRWLYVGIFP